MSKFILKKKLLHLAIIMFFLSSFFLYFIHRETKLKHETAREIEIKLEAQTKEKENIRSLAKVFQNANNEINMLNSHFVYSSNVVPFFDFLEKSALLVGAVSEVASVDVPKDNTTLLSEVRAKGSFESLYKFLLLLENAPYELEIMYMDIKKENSLEPTSKWNGVFKIKLVNFLP